MAKVVKYTLENGVSFSSASKVVRGKWESGDRKGAYETYIQSKYLEPMEKAGMSKALRMSWQRSLESGLRTEEDARNAISEYEREVASNINENLKEQYGTVISYLKDTGDPALRSVVDKIESLIDQVSGWYHKGGAKWLAKEIEKVLSSKEGLELSDKALAEMETAMDYYVDIQDQKETAGKFKFVNQE